MDEGSGIEEPIIVTEGEPMVKEGQIKVGDATETPQGVDVAAAIATIGKILKDTEGDDQGEKLMELAGTGSAAKKAGDQAAYIAKALKANKEVKASFEQARKNKEAERAKSRANWHISTRGRGVTRVSYE